MDVKTLLALAQNAVDVGNVNAAAEFYEVALTRSPNNIDVLEAYAELMIHHVGDAPRAVEMLRHAIEVDPDRGYVKYLNLAQLCEADESLECYRRALGVIGVELSTGPRKTKKRLRALRETLATVHCAVAELFLTDLCYAPDAEMQCGQSLDAALAANAECVEAHQLLASLRLSQTRPGDALISLRRAVELTHTLSEAHQPAYESKIELGRLLMQTAPDEAFHFLLEVLQLGDNNPYVWFLLGETARLRRRYVDAARLLRRARVLLIISQAQPNGEALRDVDAAIVVLITEMGGPEAIAQVPELDCPNPIDLLAPEEEDEDANEHENDNVDADVANEPEWESCDEDDEEEE